MYVAYEDLGATYDYIRYSMTQSTGKLYDTTLAYRPDALSTFACFNEYGDYQPINYTKLQYPPPHSAFTDCYFEDGWGGNPNEATYSVGASPLFSILPDLTKLVPSWSYCRVDALDGVMDPPRTLNKATATVPITNTPPTAAPAAPVPPANAPPTSTPLPKVPPQHDPPDTDPSNTNGQSDSNEPSVIDPAQSPSNQNDPPGGHPSGNDPSNNKPSNNNPSNNNPSNNDPSNSDPSAQEPDGDKAPVPNDPPSNNAAANQPSNNDPSVSSPPGSNLSPANNPSSNDLPSGDNAPGHSASIGQSSPVSVAGGDQPNMPPQDLPNQGPPNGGSKGADTEQDPGLGALIANAFNNAPSPNQDHPDPIPQSGPTPMTVGGEIFTPTLAGFAIHGTSISAGGPGVVVDGTSISLQSSGSSLVIGSNTVKFNPLQTPPPKAMTVGGQVLTPIPTGFIIDGTTISPGSAGMTIAGTAVSLLPSGTGVVIGSSTVNLATQTTTQNAIIVGNQIFTPNPTGVLIDGTTLIAGGPGITIAGTAFSLLPSGIGLVIGSNTVNLTPPQTPFPNPVTVGNQVFTPNPMGFAIDGTSISAGGAGVTIDGTLISLQPSGMGLVVGSSTINVGETAIRIAAGDMDASLTTGSSGGGSASVTSGGEGTATGSSVASNVPGSSGGNITASASKFHPVVSGEQRLFPGGRGGLCIYLIAGLVILNGNMI